MHPWWKINPNVSAPRGRPSILAHRGASADAPENTLAAFREAARQGADGIEFDVRLSADGYPVVIHDRDLARTTDGAGAVAAFSWRRIRALDAGAWFDARFAGEGVPSLDDVVALARDLDLAMNVEIKAEPGHGAATARIVARDLKAGWPKAAPPPLISSSSASALLATAAIWPAAPRALVAGRPPRDWRSVLARLGARRIHLRDRWLGKRCIARLARAGIAAGVYTVNDAARARRLAAFGVAAIFTDRPGDMRRALGEGGGLFENDRHIFGDGPRGPRREV